MAKDGASDHSTHRLRVANADARLEVRLCHRAVSRTGRTGRVGTPAPRAGAGPVPAAGVWLRAGSCSGLAVPRITPAVQAVTSSVL